MRLMEWLRGGGEGGGGHGGEDRLRTEGKHRGMEERGGKNSGEEEKEGKCSGRGGGCGREDRFRTEGKFRGMEERGGKNSGEEEKEGKYSTEERGEREEKSIRREEIEEKQNKLAMTGEKHEIKTKQGKDAENKDKHDETRQNKQKYEERRENKEEYEEGRENKEKHEEIREIKQRYKETRGCGSRLFLLLLLVGLVTAATAQHNPFDDDDDELAFSLNRLYRDSEAAMDPHNMLPEPGGVRYHGRGGKATARQKEDEEAAAAAAGSEGREEGASSPELNNCIARLVSLQNSLEEEQVTSLKLQKMLAKEGVLDLQAFYRRAVQHLWNTLQLQEAQHILKEGDAALVRQVTVHVTQDHWEALNNYLHSETDPHKVDEFLQQGFTLQTPASESSPSLLQSAITLGQAVVHAGKSLEVWLCVLCGGFVALTMWAVVLFVRDIQRELRWGYVLWMMAAVVFFICCLWHWRHMYKMAESRRHAELARRGYAGIPEECQPGVRSSAGTVYDWVKVNLFGSPDVCDKYFEQLMIDATEEITPGMVIAETVSRFLFQPLQHLGTESGKLTTNFYKNVPVAYHLHATALFLGLLVVVLFYGCAYGIDFPLGLGGYRPMARQDSTLGDRAGLGREAVEQLNRDREKFLDESRRMLTDIAKAVEGTKGPQQQLVVTSSGILEAQLERLISRHLDRAMEQQSGAPANPGVHTITSTPLRPHGTTRAVVQHTSPDQHSQGQLGDLSSSSSSSEDPHSPGLMDEPRDPKALPVAIDAVHRRVEGRAAVPVLPPRNPSRPGSTTTSAATTPSASEAGSPSAARRKKGSRLMRMFRSTETPPSPPPSPSASTQSLGNTGLDEPDLGLPPDSDSFLAEVRSVLDISANSGPPSPPSQD